MNGKVTVDQLAQVIRTVDGGQSLGAAALAEAILEALPHLQPATPMESMGKRKLIQLEGDGYITNGVAIFNPATGQRGLVDAQGYVGWVDRAKPEAVRLRDELRERAEFDRLHAIIGAANLWWQETGHQQFPGAPEWVPQALQILDEIDSGKLAWQAALAATGKQQVGQESAGQPEKCRSGAELQAEQAGEVQGDSVLRADVAPSRRFDPVADEAALSTAAPRSPATAPYWTQAHAEALNEAVHTSLSVYAAAFSQKKRDAISGHIRNLLIDKAVQS